MALTPGAKLGPYEIQSPLGAGGMGEVYRATDTKLGRDVALKVLPAEMAHDPERLSRFRREAKALAQLDHGSWREGQSRRGCRRLKSLAPRTHTFAGRQLPLVETQLSGPSRRY